MTMSTPGGRQDEDLPGLSRSGKSGPQAPRAARKSGSRSGGGRRRASMRGPIRTLIALAVLTLLIFGGIGAAHTWANPRAELTPQLGLDLAGGRQVILSPVTEDGASVRDEQLDQAIDIIRRRVDGGGVSEAEISRMGGNISVAIPGNPTPAQLEALSRSSQMTFRPVLAAIPAGMDEEEQVGPRFLPLTPSLLQEQVQEAEDARQALEDASATAEPDSADSTNGSTAPADEDAEATEEEGNRGGTRLPADNGTDTEEGTGAPGDPAESTEPPAPPASNPSDLAQVTPELQQELFAMTCTGDEALEASQAPSDQPVVTCSTDGAEKYILGPVELTGANLTDASANPEQLAGGGPTGRWEVNLVFDSEGRERFGAITTRLMGFQQGSPQNRFAMVLDGGVISAPSTNSAITDGQARISGTFTAEEAETLANQLRFGSLPLTFVEQTSEQISPTLGGEQLRWGIIAGAIGLGLVFLFMLIQYHALGLVAIGSLIVAAILAYGSVTLLGWATNFRLTMAGVTGLIVAIGITADSFIVYFERIRDEVRAGRPLRYAVDTGWARARRTLIISDVVNLIAAGVLYFLSEAGVAAFAFALGLTTIIDLIVVFMFTHPVVSILANTRFFGEGRRWSGMEPERLGASRSAYLGRGQMREPVLPERRRHTREELEGGVV